VKKGLAQDKAAFRGRRCPPEFACLPAKKEDAMGVRRSCIQDVPANFPLSRGAPLLAPSRPRSARRGARLRGYYPWLTPTSVTTVGY